MGMAAWEAWTWERGPWILGEGMEPLVLAPETSLGTAQGGRSHGPKGRGSTRRHGLSSGIHGSAPRTGLRAAPGAPAIAMSGGSLSTGRQPCVASPSSSSLSHRPGTLCLCPGSIVQVQMQSSKGEDVKPVWMPWPKWDRLPRTVVGQHQCAGNGPRTARISLLLLPRSTSM